MKPKDRYNYLESMREAEVGNDLCWSITPKKYKPSSQITAQTRRVNKLIIKDEQDVK